MEESVIKWVPILEKPFQMSSRNLKCLDWNEDNYLFIGFQGTLCALNLSNFNIAEEYLNLPIKLTSEERDSVAFQRILTLLERDDDDWSDSEAEKNYLGFGELISVGVGNNENDFYVVKGIPLRSLRLSSWLGACIGAVVSGTSQNGASIFLRKENGGSLMLDSSSGSPWRDEFQFDVNVGILADMSFLRETAETSYSDFHDRESLLFCFCGTGGAELWRLCTNRNQTPLLKAHFLVQLTNECVGSCKFVLNSASIILSLGEQNGVISIYHLSKGNSIKVAQFNSDICSIIIEQCWFPLNNNTWTLIFSGGNSLCSVELELSCTNQAKLEQVAAIPNAHHAFITCICCNRWGHFATASLDGSIKLWTGKLQLITVIRDEDHSYSLHGLAFSPNGLCLAVLGNIRLETDERLTGAKPHSSVLIYCPVEGYLYEEKYLETWRYFLDDNFIMKETHMRLFITWDMELAIFRIWQAKKDQKCIKQFIKDINTDSHSNESIVHRRILYCLKHLACKYLNEMWSESLRNEQSALIGEHIHNSLKQLYKRNSTTVKIKNTRSKGNDSCGTISTLEQGAVEAMLGYLQKWQPQSYSEHWKQFEFLTDWNASRLEFCPICKERNLLPCSRNTPLVSSCLHGHIFRRCILSLLPIVKSNNSMTCPSCRSGAIFFSLEVEWLSERYVCTLCQQPLSFIEMNAEQEFRLFKSLRKNITAKVG